MPRTIIDIHVLQTIPPSNINRDDTGSPKTAVYGGVRRARVSSQAWKRATRKDFEQVLDSSELGDRTKRVAELVAEEIRTVAPELADSAEALAVTAFAAAGIKIEKPKAKKGEAEQPAQSGYLLFLSHNQIRNLAELAIESERSGVAIGKNAAKDAANSEHSIDLALFGRMVAEAPDLNVDACAQVAHAISVHAVDNEYDYFTAVDDKAPADNAGAGMIGTVEFNSSTLYRYATVNVDALQASLGNAAAAARAVEAFIRSFVTSMPTGKQNTFANRTLPDAVVVFVRNNQPVNLVGAFEDAIELRSDRARMGEASSRLADYSLDLDRAYGQSPDAAYVVRVGDATKPLIALGEDSNLDFVVGAVGDLVRQRGEAQS